ncbi:uncharacterized protein [Haliotis asinina]|uniref:uncharacterized protein n=1 Tax=Haliotis asinina TaxID=109174 RepID=UPI003531CC10
MVTLKVSVLDTCWDAIFLGAERTLKSPRGRTTAKKIFRGQKWIKVSSGGRTTTTKPPDYQEGTWMPSSWGRKWTLKSPRGRTTAKKIFSMDRRRPWILRKGDRGPDRRRNPGTLWIWCCVTLNPSTWTLVH